MTSMSWPSMEKKNVEKADMLISLRRYVFPGTKSKVALALLLIRPESGVAVGKRERVMSLIQERRRRKSCIRSAPVGLYTFRKLESKSSLCWWYQSWIIDKYQSIVTFTNISHAFLYQWEWQSFLDRIGMLPWCYARSLELLSHQHIVPFWHKHIHQIKPWPSKRILLNIPYNDYGSKRCHVG